MPFSTVPVDGKTKGKMHALDGGMMCVAVCSCCPVSVFATVVRLRQYAMASWCLLLLQQ